MLKIQNNLDSKYNAFIEQRGVETGRHRYYVKWPRYYLDFCHKYSFNQTEKESLPHILKKPLLNNQFTMTQRLLPRFQNCDQIKTVDPPAHQSGR